MSKWKVTLSDGRVATLEGDTEPTEQDALAAIGTLHPGTPETSTDELKPWTPAQRLRYSPVGQAILGPTEEEKARQVGRSNIGLAEIPSAFLQMSTLGIPPVQEAEQKFTEFQKGIAAKLPGALGQAAQIPIGIQHGIRQALLGFPVLPLPAVGPAAGATRTVGRGLFGYFAAEWASQLPEQYKQYQEAVAKGDYSTASGIAANAASMAAMMGLGAKEALKKGAPNAIPQREAAPVSVEKPPGDRPQVEPQVRIETSAEKEATEPVLSPEHDALVQAEAQAQGVKVRPQQLPGRVVSTINRATGEVLIDPAQLTEEISKVPEKQREQYIRSLINEEKIHLGVTDEQALAYLGSLSRPEVAIATRIYTGKWGGHPQVTPTMLAHDALRFRLQQLARMTPREIAEAAWRERWTVQSLDAVGRSIQAGRELMNTAGGKEGLAIIRAIDNNLAVAKAAATAPTQEDAYEAAERAGMAEEGAAPAAVSETEPFALRKQEVEKDIADYEELSKRFRQIGFSHPDSRRVMQDRENIKNKYGGMEPKPDFAQPETVHAENGVLVSPAAYRKAYQGSPHDITDRFRTEKIGSGEGAAVYGWGFYFAEKPEVAKEYHRQLAPDLSVEKDVDGFVAIDRKNGDVMGRFDTEKEADQFIERKGGGVYTVELKAEPEELLNWDTGIGFQPESVYAKLVPLAQEIWPKASLAEIENTSVQNLMRSLSAHETPKPTEPSGGGWGELQFGHLGPEKASTRLSSLGIKGVRYLDQGSRGLVTYPQAIREVKPGGPFEVYRTDTGKTTSGPFNSKGDAQSRVDAEAGKQTHNYVIFDPKDIAIREKNGKAVSPEQAMQQPFAFRKGKQKGEPTKEFFLPPVPQGTQVERGVELPRPSLTPAQIEAQATKHVTETSRPSFAQFAEEATKELPSLKPEQLRSVWQDAVWKRLMSASGGDLESLRNQLGLAREVGSGDISDAPASQEAFRLGVRDREAETAVRPTQNYRNRVIARIGEKLIGEAEQGRKAWRRPAVNPEEVATYKGEGAYREISPADVKNPDELGRLLTEGAGVERTTSTRKVRGGELVEVKRKAPPESVTRRLTALVNKSTGKVYLVSTYRHGRLGAMLVDPAATKAERPNVPLKSLLNRGYQPIASMLLDEPVQNFKQGFANVADWQARFAGEVAKAQAAEASYLPTTEGEFTTGPGGARVATPGVFQEREGAVASREPMTDAEAGSILDHVVGEVGTLEGVEDVKLAMETLPTEKNQQVLSAWRKLARAVEAANPDATVEELKNKLADTIYENHRQAQDFQDFQRKTMAAANPENRPGVGPPPAPAPAAQPSAAARAAVEPAAWNKHVRAATKETSRAFDNFIARPLDAYSGWMVNRMREHGGVASEMAGMLFNRVISRQKQVYGSMTPSLDPALRLAGKGSKANAWLNSLTKHPGGRTGTAKLFDAGEGRIPVPAFARPSLDVYNAANLATGRVLEPVTPDWAASGRYQRNVTPFGYDLIRQGKGPLWQAWVQDTARINGVPHGITARFFREWKAALDDPGLDVNRIEKINQDFERQYPRVVTHLKIGEGVTTRWEPVVHSRVFNYLQNTALRASHIRAFREAFPATEVGRKRLATMDDQVREELSPEFQEDYNALLKTLQGHPSDTYGGAGPLSAGGPIAESFRWLNQTAGNLFARMVLTGQMFVQPGENIAGSTPVFLGYRNYLRGLARVKHLLPQLEQEGKINRVIYDNSSDPTSPVRTAFRRAGNVLSRGFGEQLLNELQEWHAAATAQIVSERIQAGTLSGWEMRMLPETFKAMGFSPAEAQRMMQGDRNLLGQFERKSAAFLTSGNKAMAEGSRLGSNRLFNSIFRFQSYPMMKMNQFRRLWGGLSDAWQMGTREQKVAATELFSRFLFGTAVQGALTVGISALAYEGFTGAKIRATEAKDDPLTFLLESAMATLGGPFYLVWRGARSKGIYGIGEQFTRLLFPYSIARDMFDAAHGSGQYKDLDAFERIGKFVASKTPGTRAIKLGMAVFGLSQEDTKLDGSIKSFYRWRRDTLGFKESQDFLQSDERAAFRKAMKRAVEALKIGDREKFSEAFAEAVGESGNAKAVAQSFRARKLLRTPEGAKLNFDQLDALRRHVGDDAVDRLEYFDAMLDAASHGVVLPKGD